MLQPPRRSWTASLALTSVALTIAGISSLGCSQPNEYQPPPPPEVDVAQPQTQPVEDFLEFTGTTEATDVVDIRARVGGYLKSIHFDDGSIVKKGDLLFVIEPEPFEVALQSAEANLQKAQAALALAKTNLARTEPLARKQAVSIEELDVAKANVATAEADVAAAQAMVAKARLDLSYTRITAPLSGRIGRHLVDVGNLIVPQSNVLTTIENFSPIFVYFTISESDVHRLLERQQRGTTSASYRELSELQLGLTEGGDYPFRGKLDFAEIGLDADTGTQLRRGVFNNEDQRLLPGMFVRVRLPLGQPQPRLLVDERAIAADQRGEYVLVVNDRNVVEHRPVDLGRRVDGKRVIEQGVAADEWIVVNGLQRARPGAPVTPVDTAGEPLAQRAGDTPDSAPLQTAAAPANATRSTN